MPPFELVNPQSLPDCSDDTIRLHCPDCHYHALVPVLAYRLLGAAVCPKCMVPMDETPSEAGHDS
jgi:hypothetical protein